MEGHNDKGKILKIIEDHTGKESKDKCKVKTSRTDWLLLGLLHIIIIGIPFSALLIRSILEKSAK